MDWFVIQNTEDIPSPALVIYKDRVQSNIRKMVNIAGAPERLRPHLKTCKSPEVTELLLEAGIKQFKVATIAEAEMAANSGASDILVSYPLSSPDQGRLARLIKAFPQTVFATTVDNEESLESLSQHLCTVGVHATVYLDINPGMNRTGITAGESAQKLYSKIPTTKNVSVGGLHVYDGHVTNPDPSERKTKWSEAMSPFWSFHDSLETKGLPIPLIVAGGSPTFAFHADDKRVQCSPGTTVFWDAGYGSKFPDLPFQPAALVVTRVVSNPLPGRYCLDLGHKAIAAENPHPRVIFLNCPDAKPVMHSEEHLVIETSAPLKLGEVLYGVPWHVCPTVALHAQAHVVQNHRASYTWEIASRNRRLLY